jgi:predicted ATPase/class 3 adenylate cyclase
VNAVSIIPVGTVTFLFTDLEGSTRSWEQQGRAMSKALARHDAIVRTACAGNNGYVFKTLGDAFCVAFGAAHDALAAAIDLQLGLLAEDWQAMGMATPLSLRLALHTGPVETRDGDYFGPTLNRTSRLLATAHGGQSLLSEVTAMMVREHLLGNMALKGLGEHRLKDLQRPESVYQLVCPPLPVDFPPLRSLEGRPHNLPLQLTLFVGRETALADAAMRLRDPGTRLLTLLGPGGTGKTRIALQLAAECLDDFADGVFFVALDPVRDTEHVALAITSALGLKEGGGSQVRGAVGDFLASRNLLLVLDNFEQVVEAGPLVSELLRRAPGLKVVVTSREALRVPGERVLAVPPLELPSLGNMPSLDQLVQFEAVRLFIDRATLVKADFTVTNENAPAVAEICHRLDGLPLAIELASSRVRLFDPEALLLRLDKGLGSTLTGSSRGLSARQQTLNGAITWSVDLLTPGERTLFTRLSVFMGGFTIDAAERVACDPGELGMVGNLDILSAIEGLSDKSLVRRDGGTATEPRFRMLETIRDHAVGMAREAGMEAALRDRHLQWITDLFTGAEEDSRRAGGLAVMDRLHAELGNLRRALAWAGELPVDGARVTLGLQTCVAGAAYWRMRHNNAEGIVALDRLLSLVDPLMPGGTATALNLASVPADVVAYARTQAMGLRAAPGSTTQPAWLRPMLDGAITQFRAVGDRRGEGRALMQLASFLGYFGDRAPESRETALAAALAATGAGDTPTAAFAHCRAAMADLREGKDGDAGRRFVLAVELAEASGDTWATANGQMLLAGYLYSQRQWEASATWAARHEAAGGAFTTLSLFVRANVGINTGDFPTARAFLTRISDGIASGHLSLTHAPLHKLVQGHLARLEGRTEDASACFREVLASNLAAKESWLTQWCLVGLAWIEHSGGMAAPARELLARALSLDPDGNSLVSPLPSMVAAVAELVVATDAERGSVIWAMAACLGNRARYHPMYAQDVARITEIVDRAREDHGIPVPDVPADLTAADAIAECLGALASLDMAI